MKIGHSSRGVDRVRSFLTLHEMMTWPVNSPAQPSPARSGEQTRTPGHRTHSNSKYRHDGSHHRTPSETRTSTMNTMAFAFKIRATSSTNNTSVIHESMFRTTQEHRHSSSSTNVARGSDDLSANQTSRHWTTPADEDKMMNR